jgi:hypothetical protein
MHGSYNEHLSNHAVAFLLAFARRFEHYRLRWQRSRSSLAHRKVAFPECSGLLRQQLRDLVDEFFGRVDRRAGAIKRYVGIGPQRAIGDRLDVVGLGQELAQLETEPRLVSRQPGELGVHALVGLGVFAGALRDQNLRRVKGREVGIAAGVFAYSGGENSSRAGQAPRNKHWRALSKCSFASGVTDRRLRGEFPASATCDLHRRPPGEAWRG